MVPKIRVKGYNTDWRESVVGDLGSAYSGLSGKTKEDFGKGDAKYITFLNVLTNAQIDTNILEPVNVCVGEKQNKVQKGDLLFNTSSETPEEVGMCAVMGEDVDNVYLNSFCFGFRLTDTKTSPLFISYLLRSPIGRRLMSVLAQGATRYNLAKSSFCKASILLPSTKEEQLHIADFFANLDSQIAIQSQHLKKLSQIKAASLQTMFPQEGEKIPRVRFKGFEGEWKTVELNKVGFMTAGGTPSTFIANYWNGNINWLQSGTVQNGIIHSSSVTKKITEEGLMNSSAYLIKKNSVLIAITGATCANVGYLPFESTANQSVVSIEPSREYDSKFLFQLLINERNQILSFKGGSAQSGVSLSNLKKLQIKCPSYDEQVLIGSYFFTLDKTIEFYQSELEKSKQIKAACLDLMLV